MNNHDYIKREVLRWLSHSKEELGLASQLVDGTYAPRFTCWHCQQSVKL